jgi:TetR/AcrR family transcriptional repressor of mexJK operon
LTLATLDKRRAGRPTQDDARRKSETVLEVATGLFVERGFNGATMEAVALAADIGKQALYQRYPDKDALFTAVIERLKDDDFFQPLPADDGGNLRGGLGRMLRAILTECARPKSVLICKLVMREGHRFPALLSLITDTTLERFIGPLAAWLDRRKAAGEIRDIDALAVAGMCADLIFAEITRAMFRDEELSAEDVARHAERIADLVLSGVAK